MYELPFVADTLTELEILNIEGRRTRMFVLDSKCVKALFSKSRTRSRLTPCAESAPMMVILKVSGISNPEHP